MIIQKASIDTFTVEVQLPTPSVKLGRTLDELVYHIDTTQLQAAIHRLRHFVEREDSKAILSVDVAHADGLTAVVVFYDEQAAHRFAAAMGGAA